MIYLNESDDFDPQTFDNLFDAICNAKETYLPWKICNSRKFTGYAEVTIEADTEQEAIDLYNEGSYDDDVYIKDDMYYDFQFDSIKEAD